MRTKKIRISCIIMVAMLFLCSCGSTADTNDSVSKESDSKENCNYSLSEYLAEKAESIWYKVKENDGVLGKDSHISSIYVFEDKKLTIYDSGAAEQAFGSDTFGNVAKLKDSDIKEKLKEGSIKYGQILKENRMKQLRQEKTDKNFQKAIDYMESYQIVGSKPYEYRLGIETDGTGNATLSETIYGCSYDEEKTWPWVDGFRIEEAGSDFTPVVYETDLLGAIGGIQVYDSKYAGFSIKVNYRDGGFITRIEDGTTLNLDEPGAENVYVDVQDEQIEEELKGEQK